MKLNVGCGTDYLEGFINIDGSDTLAKVDRIIDLSAESLLLHFPEGQVVHIIANDIIEHHYHWEAVRIMQDFYRLLARGGIVEIRVPDAEFIITNASLSIGKKLNLLFGGQDIPQGLDPQMDESRKMFPQFFCHKFGWTMTSMRNELEGIGFSNIVCNRSGTNFVAFATR